MMALVPPHLAFVPSKKKRPKGQVALILKWRNSTPAWVETKDIASTLVLALTGHTQLGLPVLTAHHSPIKGKRLVAPPYYYR